MIQILKVLPRHARAHEKLIFHANVYAHLCDADVDPG